MHNNALARKGHGRLGKFRGQSEFVNWAPCIKAADLCSVYIKTTNFFVVFVKTLIHCMFTNFWAIKSDCWNVLKSNVSRLTLGPYYTKLEVNIGSSILYILSKRGGPRWPPCSPTPRACSGERRCEAWYSLIYFLFLFYFVEMVDEMKKSGKLDVKLII